MTSIALRSEAPRTAARRKRIDAIRVMAVAFSLVAVGCVAAIFLFLLVGSLEAFRS